MNDMHAAGLSQARSWSRHYATLVHATLFVFGFSLVFVVGWGGAATLLGRMFGQYKLLIGRAGPAVSSLFYLVSIRWVSSSCAG